MALSVVTGPPAGGKTTWVAAHAQPGDVVIDLDRIAQALSPPGAGTHEYGRVLRTIAQRARSAAVTEALRYCQAVEVWIIHTQPTEAQLATYAQHGGRVVVVDPGKDVVMARCDEQRSRSSRSAAEHWYATQGEHHTESQSSSRTW